MPANGYSVGRDISLDIIGPNGPLRFPVRTGFQAQQQTSDLKVRRADGIVDHVILPDGWSGSFDFERTGPQLDNYFAGQEDKYFNGQNLDVVSITETVQEPDGSLSQWRYTRCVLQYADAGAKSGGDTVKQKVNWMASRRIKIA